MNDFFFKLNYFCKITLLWIISRNRCISPSFCTAWLSAYARMCSSLSLLRNNFLQPGTLHFSAFSGHWLMCMVTWHLTYTMERKDQHMKLNLFDALLHGIRDLSYRRQVWPGIVASNYLGRGRDQTPDWSNIDPEGPSTIKVIFQTYINISVPHPIGQRTLAYMHPWCDIASLSTFFPQSGQSTLPFAHNGKCPGMFSRSHLNAQPLGQDTTHLSQSFPCFSASGNFPFQRQPLLAQVTSKLLVNLRMATFIVSSSFPNWWRHSAQRPLVLPLCCCVAMIFS